MSRPYQAVLLTAIVAAVIAAVALPVWAGRVARGNDPGFELCRIVSAYQGGTSETIGPAETEPTQPIVGETVLIGTSMVFPEFVKVETFRSSQGWKLLQPSDFSFKTASLTPDGSQGTLTGVVIRFAADKVSLIQNAFVRITIQPMPGPDLSGDMVEGVTLRSP